MIISIVPVHASHSIHAFAAEGIVVIESTEEISCNHNQVGIILGKNRHHRKGWFMQGGLVNPGWRGKLTIEIKYNGEIQIDQGDEVAQVIIFEGEVSNLSEPCLILMGSQDT